MKKNELREGKTEPIQLYRMTNDDIVLGCNEFDNVYLVVKDVANLKEAKVVAKKFLKAICTNGHTL